MASIVEEFEYDIFISYRHNDNLDGWVTHFVESLEKELRGTLKESLTIYFDKNPHDGLLETHNVDKSLEGKLKCLIFIPIISQTYCDPKSFAWEHEFVAFNKLAQIDQFGRDIKLGNGNVASRILPIKIHDLDVDDQSIIEKEISGALRAIEFIFKSPGVNRPLGVNEDHANDNLNKTYYKDQVNKVANSIKEIIQALRHQDKPTFEKLVTGISQPRQRTRKYIAVLSLVAIIIALVSYLFYSQMPSLAADGELIDKSVAVLAFTDMSPGKDQEWFSDGLTEEILNSLANLKELKVTSRTSSFYFKGKNVPLQEISEMLGVAHVVEGSVRKIDKRLRISAQLIRVNDGFHVWSRSYDRSSDDLFEVQKDIAENIARALLKELTPEKLTKLTLSKPNSVEAYEYYLRGLRVHNDQFLPTNDLVPFKESEKHFLKSISLDDSYSESYAALADLYDSYANIPGKYQEKYRGLRDSVMQIAYRIDPNSIMTLAVYSFSLAKRKHPNLDSAFYYIQKAYRLSPENEYTEYAIGEFYRRIGLSELSTAHHDNYAAQHPLDVDNLNRLIVGKLDIGNYDEAEVLCKKSVDLNQDNFFAYFSLGQIYVKKGLLTEANQQLNKLKELHRDALAISLEAMILAKEGKRLEALKLSKDLEVLSLLGMKKEFLATLDSISKIKPTHPLSFQRDPMYQFVKEESKYKAIVEKATIDHHINLAKYGKLE